MCFIIGRHYDISNHIHKKSRIRQFFDLIYIITFRSYSRFTIFQKNSLHDDISFKIQTLKVKQIKCAIYKSSQFSNILLRKLNHLDYFQETKINTFYICQTSKCVYFHLFQRISKTLNLQGSLYLH